MTTTLSKIDKSIIEDKANLNRLMLVTWFDPYDNPGEEVNIDSISIERACYKTSGFLLGVSNDHLVLGINQELNSSDRHSGAYKGYSAVPISLITNVQIMDRNF